MSLSGCKKNGEDSKAEDKAKQNDFSKPKPNNCKMFPAFKTPKQPQAARKGNQPLPKIH